jgi:hypothetical protein
VSQPLDHAYGAPSLRVKGFDGHTKLFIFMIKAAIRAWKANRPSVDTVRPPQLEGPLPLVELPFGTASDPVRLPTIDEDWPPADFKRKAMLWLLRNGVLFPVRDYADSWVNAEEARDTYQEILPLGSFMARPYHSWTEMTSDAAMSRIGFAGLGALRMLPPGVLPAGTEVEPGTAWVSDLSYLGAYEVREGFERYGARACFDAEQRPIAIYWCHAGVWVRPGDAAWAHAKWVWRCSLLVGTTVTDHLVGCHWLIANYVSTASRQTLSATHPLRLLLKPFTWRTITINYGASDTLCPERGFVHRGSALTADALTRAFRDSVGLIQFHTVRELVERKGARDMGDRFPWATDALALFEVIHTFVEDYLGRYFTPESLDADVQVHAFWNHLVTAPASVRFPARTHQGVTEVLAQFIWSVTGLHEAVGTVHEYVLNPTFMGTKIRPGTEMADVQTSIQGLLVMALTGLEMPALLALGDAAGIYGVDDRGREAFQRFHDNLVALAAQIDAANARRLADPERPWPCNTFNPNVLETGVSI